MATNALIVSFIMCCSVSSLTAAAMHMPAASSNATEELALSSSGTNTLKYTARLSRPHRRETDDNPVCGGDGSLSQCGTPFPSDFCCPPPTKCLRLDSSAIAVLCCPAGLDCKFISRRMLPCSLEINFTQILPHDLTSVAMRVVRVVRPVMKGYAQSRYRPRLHQLCPRLP
jgi:hypothetical protein